MSLILVIIIVALGLAFIFIEIFLIPGTALVGLLGGVMVVAGVVLAYINFGSQEGNIVLIISTLAFIIMTIGGFKRINSLKWGLKENIESRVNVLQENLVQIGDEGTTFSDLRPNGKAVINNLRLEVYSNGDYIDKDTQVVVTKVTNSKIFVKPKQS